MRGGEYVITGGEVIILSVELIFKECQEMRKTISVLVVLILVLMMAPRAQGMALDPWACVLAEEEGWPVDLTFYCLVQIMMEAEDEDGWQWAGVTPKDDNDKKIDAFLDQQDRINIALQSCMT